MTNSKGTVLETAAVRWFREHGWQFARRIVKEGQRDKGDVTLGDGIPVTIEAKNTKAINLAGGQKELADEMANAGNEWGFTIHKKRGTADVGKYYAVLPVEVLNDILHVALGQREALIAVSEELLNPKELTIDGDGVLQATPRKRVIPRQKPS